MPTPAITKKEQDGEHPASHYLVVEDPESPSTWHLRVRNAAGELDHGLMGAAWAALHEGYRGNRYEGPSKQDAIAKLKKLYDQEDMPTPGPRKTTEVKFLDETANHILIGGYGVAFGGLDLERDTFLKPPGTDFMLDLVPKKLITYDHRQNDPIKNFIGQSMSETIDDDGIWVEAELRKSAAYIKRVMELLKQGVLGYSSGSVSHLIDKIGGTIKQWPIVEYALTATPAEPRLIGVRQMKALAAEDPSLQAILLQDPDGSNADAAWLDRSRLLKLRTRILLLENEK